MKSAEEELLERLGTIFCKNCKQAIVEIKHLYGPSGELFPIFYCSRKCWDMYYQKGKVSKVGST